MADHNQNTDKQEFSTSRRAALFGMSGIAAAGLLTGCGAQADAATDEAVNPPAVPQRGAELILLGTHAGPPVFPERTGISTALAVDGDIYLVDCGRSAVTQYSKAGLDFSRLKNIFVTHLHADHVADYYNFLLLSGAAPTNDGDILGTIGVYGPGSAEGLPAKFGGGSVPTVHPEEPTPGIKSMTSRLHEAYAYSTNVFMRDSAMPDIRAMAEIHEMAIPETASYQNTAPEMQPFAVMEDSKVKVTATLVPHGPVFPSYALRFDTDYGSVTFSGDTTQTPNLVTLAEGTDILVHEAINIRGADLTPEFKNHMLESHVEIQEIGPIAEAVKTPQLVLSHIGDRAREPIDSEQWTSWAQKGFSGKVVVGEDLQRFRL